MAKKEKLKEINRKIDKCRKCSLWKRAKNAVPGEGSERAKIFFIGEAPGREEDLSGRPFVGRAGRFLDKLLRDNKIDRKKVFITSVIKHRPSNNRLPKRSELENCAIWWQKQIEIVKPKLIVLLGRVAFETVIRNKSFSKYRGKFLIKDNQRYFVLYHPAAGVRFQKFKKILERDFKKIDLTKKKI